MLTPSIITRPVFGKTRRILPSFPWSSPRTTRTVSPLARWSRTRATLSVCRLRLTALERSVFRYLRIRISDDLGRQRDDLHVLLLAELARHGPEDAGGPRLALLVDDDHRVFVEPDVAPVLAASLLGPPLHRR